MSFGRLAIVSALCGYLSLSYEILWFRAYSFATAGAGWSFSFFLATFLFGLSLGSLATRVFFRARDPRPEHLRALALSVLAGNVAAFLAAPIHGWWSTVLPASVPTFALVSALLGAPLPLISHIGLRPDQRVGRGLSYIYLANIAGSVVGSLGTGFGLMQVWSFRGISLFLLVLGLALSGLLAWSTTTSSKPRVAWLAGSSLVAALAFAGSPLLFDRLYERLQLKHRFGGADHLVDVIENRSGVITVDDSNRVFGSGIYDGAFNVDPRNRINMIFRIYAALSMRPASHRVLMIGLSSGSWGQVIANDAAVERFEVVEINPGYLDLIPKHPEVASLLTNPKVRVTIDDGRRWLERNDDRFDLIVMNTTYFWRSHSTNLLSVEFLALARAHLLPGGALFYNTTESPRVQRTAAVSFPYATMVGNFAAVSDAPLVLDKERWRELLAGYAIDGRPLFDMTRSEDRAALDGVVAYADTWQTTWGVDSRARMLARTEGLAVYTEDNMGDEWNVAYGPPSN